ncbi:MAG: hypothetical protein H7235_12170 [Bdellovibrionaceae bacterium]|nr:hypothetical protein [Pseudobdellovibrionaceae bacterium]
MILQLNPSLPVETKAGKGQAVALIDYSPEHDLYWVVFLDQSRECWTFSNKEILAQSNFTLGRQSSYYPPLDHAAPGARPSSTDSSGAV